jgi:hypothetical protein
LRKTARLRFRRPTVFLGRDYPAGTHEIDISEALMPVVEYMAPGDIDTLQGVELHFRINESSGWASRDAWTFVSGLGVERPHQHVHIVAPLRTGLLRRWGPLQALRQADFVRRVNLLAEMVSIVRYGESIAKVQEGTVTYFGPMTSGVFHGIITYFMNISNGMRPAKIGDDYKIGWVGMRGSDKYDEPGLWGLEYRAISADSDPRLTQKILDAVQGQMESPDFGMDSGQVKAWIAQDESPATLGLRLRDTWYNRDYPLGKFTSREAALLENAVPDHQELMMLLHDWSVDPMFFNRPEVVSRVARAQAAALRQLFSTRAKSLSPEHVNSVMVRFLIDSDLYAEVQKSFGIRLPGVSGNQ